MNPTISSVALHVVGRYNEAGHACVAAYRTGGHRLLDGTAARYAQTQKVTDFLGTRLDVDTDRIVAVMDRAFAVSTTSIETVANRAAQIESPLAATLIKTVSALNVPIAVLSAQIADQVAAGAKQLEARVAGAQSQDVEAPIQTETAVARKAKPARRAAAKSA